MTDMQRHRLFSSAVKRVWLVCLMLVAVFTTGSLLAQDKPAEPAADGAAKPAAKPAKKKHLLKWDLDESGKTYLRLIHWTQGQVYGSDGSEESGVVPDVNSQIRRHRYLFFGKPTENTLILGHFGINSLNADALSGSGNHDAGELYVHGAWTEYSIAPGLLDVGYGLHYWNGISRINNQSTLSFLTADNPAGAVNWPTLNISDQFGRHIGFYAKGVLFDRLGYRAAVNQTAGQSSAAPTTNAAAYSTRGIEATQHRGRMAFAGYFEYMFLDKESYTLPYKTGSYHGSKTVFNIGLGAYYHPEGSIVATKGKGDFFVKEVGSDVNAEDPLILGADVYYDAPIGKGALTAYGVVYIADYGKNYVNSMRGSGMTIYSQVGYVLPFAIGSTKLQPYFGFTHASLDGADNPIMGLNPGLNFLIAGHSAKITADATLLDFGDDIATQQYRLAAQLLIK